MKKSLTVSWFIFCILFRSLSSNITVLATKPTSNPADPASDSDESTDENGTSIDLDLEKLKLAIKIMIVNVVNNNQELQGSSADYPESILKILYSSSDGNAYEKYKEDPYYGAFSLLGGGYDGWYMRSASMGIQKHDSLKDMLRNDTGHLIAKFNDNLQPYFPIFKDFFEMLMTVKNNSTTDAANNLKDFSTLIEERISQAKNKTLIENSKYSAGSLVFGNYVEMLKIEIDRIVKKIFNKSLDV